LQNDEVIKGIITENFLTLNSNSIIFMVALSLLNNKKVFTFSKEMIRKIYIIGLIISFLFSTTGFSITQHFCKMMEEASAEQCNMCADTQILETMACCEDDNFTGEVITSGNFSVCCVTHIIEYKVKDEFSLSGKTKLITSIVVLLINPSILESEKEGTNFQQNKYNLPPAKFGKQLLQAIHQLKIELPIC